MSVRRTKLRGRAGGPTRLRWMIDFRAADGTRIREISPVQSKRGAKQYEVQRKREVEQDLIDQMAAPVVMPTFGEFSSEFMRAEAPTTSGMREMEGKRSMLNAHLLPRFEALPLDQIGIRDINLLKGEMTAMPRAPKTVNNVLTLLKTILLYGVEAEVLKKIPKIKLLPVPLQEFDFLDFDEYAVMLEAIRKDHPLLVAVLLGAEAGLRAGEIIGLQWQDINFKLNAIRVQRQLQQGQEIDPKWASFRTVYMTSRLAQALKAHRHLTGPWVLVTGKTVRGKHSIGPWTKEVLRWRGERFYRLASLPQPKKPWHCLRQTFCSHLAMHGVHAKAIQELAGHKSLTTTMRYMHLAPSALQDAIRKLEEPAPWAEQDRAVEKKR